MNTIVTTITDHEFAALASGLKNFIVLRQKKEPLIGQRVILQEKNSADRELEYRISDVHTEPGIVKGYYILSFGETKPYTSANDATGSKLQFDFNDMPAATGGTFIGPFGEKHDASQLEDATDELPGLGDFGAENEMVDEAGNDTTIAVPAPQVPTAIDDLPF